MSSTKETPPPVTIVGTGRSGSGYISKALTACGFPTGHEEWYNPFHVHAEGLMADSSWCALAPEFEEVVRNTTVWHQVRNPFNVIASHLKHWSQSDAWWPMKESILIGEPYKDLMGLAMQSVCSAHLMAWDLTPDRTWRLEDISPVLLSELSGCRIDTAIQVFNDLPKNVNQHGITSVALGPDDLPDNNWKPKIIGFAELYGYL